MTESTIASRIIAVLQYDGIEPNRRISHLAEQCGFSRTTAKRLLNNGASKMRTDTYIKLTRGLDVGHAWLFNGSLYDFHLRTLRIHVQITKGYAPDDAANIVRMFSAVVMGHNRAKNLMEMAAAGSISYPQAARLV